MIIYKNECVDCDGRFPCVGSWCEHRNVPYLACDECEATDIDLYEFEGQILCLDCIAELLKKVN